MARRAASFVLNEPGSRHLTPPPSRTLFPVCPSRAGHGEREPATWGAEPPLLRTNLQARAACGRPAVKAPDAGTDSTTRHSPRVPSTRNGPGAPQSLSAAAGAGAWGGPATADRGRLALRAPSTRGVGRADVGGFPVGLRPRVREHVAARSSGGGAGRGRDTLPSTLLRTGSPTWPSPWPWAASQAAGGRAGSAGRLGSRASVCAHSTAAARPLRGEGEGTPRSRLPLSSPGAVRVRADGGGRGGERHPAGPAPVRPAAEDAAGPPSPGVRGHPDPGLLPFTFQKTKTPVPAGRLLAGGAALLQLREVALSTVTPLVPTRAAPPSTVGSPSPPPAPGDGPSAGCRGAPAPRWFLNGKNGSTRCRRRRGRGTRSRRAPRPSWGRLGPPGGSTGSVTPLLGAGVQGGPVLCLLRPQQPARTRAQRGPPRASGAARTHGGQRTPALPERHLSARCAPPRNSPLHPTQRGPPRAAPCAGGRGRLRTSPSRRAAPHPLHRKHLPHLRTRSAGDAAGWSGRDSERPFARPRLLPRR